MSETPNLTEKQLSAIALLVSGMTYQQTAADIGVSTKTIQRWNALDEFKAEIERRKNRGLEVHQEQADALQDEEINGFYEDLRAYREARMSIFRAKLSRGTKILKRAGERFDDLPDEAIAPGSLMSMFSVADSLCESGLNGWAEILALDELLKRIDGDGG